MWPNRSLVSRPTKLLKRLRYSSHDLEFFALLLANKQHMKAQLSLLFHWWSRPDAWLNNVLLHYSANPGTLCKYTGQCHMGLPLATRQSEHWSPAQPSSQYLAIRISYHNTFYLVKVRFVKWMIITITNYGLSVLLHKLWLELLLSMHLSLDKGDPNLVVRMLRTQ